MWVCRCRAVATTPGGRPQPSPPLHLQPWPRLLPHAACHIGGPHGVHAPQGGAPVSSFDFGQHRCLGLKQAPGRAGVDHAGAGSGGAGRGARQPLLVCPGSLAEFPSWTRANLSGASPGQDLSTDTVNSGREGRTETEEVLMRSHAGRTWLMAPPSRMLGSLLAMEGRWRGH